MKSFTALFTAVDRTTRTSEKTAAIAAYFREADADDAAWALAVLTGTSLIRRVPYNRLRAFCGEATGLPAWLIAESHSVVGDLSETLSLLLPPPTAAGEDESLTSIIETRVLPLERMSEGQQRTAILATWNRLDATQRLVFHKLISGNFRFGAAKKVVINALAEATGVPAAVMQHRMTGGFSPTRSAWERVTAPDRPGGQAAGSGGSGGGADADAAADDAARPYPFCLAQQLQATPREKLGDRSDWSVEWKWDGIRCQLLRRGGSARLWSRGEELITGTFPEVAAAASTLPEGTVLDGEILAWRNADGSADRHAFELQTPTVRGLPEPFAVLQRRLNRRARHPALFEDRPVVFMAYDVLELGGADLRTEPTHQRRAALEALAADAFHASGGKLLLSPAVEGGSWDSLGALRASSRARNVEGFMLKRRDAPYGIGRAMTRESGDERGLWWKWKVDPYAIDAVMIYAQRGTGRRSTLYTDYTFALWTGEQPGRGELVPVTKAYSGLTDAEFARVDAFIKGHRRGGRGAFCEVEPSRVFEIAFDGVQESKRHRSGLALRFPRMARIRDDKRADEADTVGFLRGLI
ncbi:ATP-dependent DNA ligase [Phycisphaera mikurensis]|uniref:DNA ligase (ATP) n=1 Tax=Phycisphaera mikurensis (strain NBRC 102666 / KCTC 22515 / FYK2301M01) TaxID=1142394 RepID=I0IDA2_PHYMF|nr:ATP-dependent DNA ligase [Phycisphaera mikurensis]MBB6442365.1 DNA ligase-1 [Phycisphaera mikurensis]BAM03240.1 putative DNA ligase [Phycisphaera mikurensis NBRC 102666]